MECDNYFQVKSTLNVIIKYVVDHFVEPSYEGDLFGVMDLIEKAF